MTPCSRTWLCEPVGPPVGTSRDERRAALSRVQASGPCPLPPLAGWEDLVDVRQLLDEHLWAIALRNKIIRLHAGLRGAQLFSPSVHNQETRSLSRGRGFENELLGGACDRLLETAGPPRLTSIAQCVGQPRPEPRVAAARLPHLLFAGVAGSWTVSEMNSFATFLPIDSQG